MAEGSAAGDGTRTASGRPNSRNSSVGPAGRGAVHLVVVESPAKARTIGNHLGAGYWVMATCDLPAKAGSVNPDEGFAMVCETGKRAARTLCAIAKALVRADTLVLATDPDREDEAIAWQVLTWLKARDVVGDRLVHRIVFHEVTPHAVRTALAQPRDIDMNLVRAWQARALVRAWLEERELSASEAAGVPDTEITDDWRAGRILISPGGCLPSWRKSPSALAAFTG